MIKEVIVVEGKDDIARIKEFVSCDVIACNGSHISPKFLKKLRCLKSLEELLFLPILTGLEKRLDIFLQMLFQVLSRPMLKGILLQKMEISGLRMPLRKK